ncbi:MAG TPA: hypothetical protein VET85_01400 [Stellaceae bacterium]|nr:hypothetical protein [Stellaceae bacterium]
MRTGYPAVSEETFEWELLLSAVLDARDRFVMIEAGAGYGRWLVTAACALRQRRPEVAFHLIGVEAEPQHFAWMKQHLTILPHDLASGHHWTGDPARLTMSPNRNEPARRMA